MATNKRHDGRFGDFAGDPTKKNNNFGDFTDSNRQEGTNLRRFSSNKTNSIGRQQGAAGSAGTTLGDNSGTGVNTSKSSGRRRRSKVKSVGTPGGERLGAAHRADPNVQFQNLSEQLRRDINGGRISSRSASKIQAGLVESLMDATTKRHRIDTVSGDKAAQLSSDEEVSVADRQAKIQEGTLNRQANQDLEATRQLGNTRRASLTNAIATDRNDLYRDQLEESTTARVQNQSNADRTFEASQDAAEAAAILGGNQATIDNRNRQFELEESTLSDFDQAGREGLASRIRGETPQLLGQPAQGATGAPQVPESVVNQSREHTLRALLVTEGVSEGAKKDARAELGQLAPDAAKEFAQSEITSLQDRLQDNRLIGKRRRDIEARLQYLQGNL